MLLERHCQGKDLGYALDGKWYIRIACRKNRTVFIDNRNAKMFRVHLAETGNIVCDRAALLRSAHFH